MHSKIYCGPAGWSRSGANRRLEVLESLAGQFGVVEIASSFHTPLKPEIATLWARRAESHPNFLFTAKLHRQFTHERLLDNQAVEVFKQGLRPLARAGKLGCLLMQFPWSFRFTAENREFLIRLRRTFHEFPLAAEMRHVSWSLSEAIGTLIDYKIGFCNIDQPSYTKAMPATSFLTSTIGYVRLHGRSCYRWFADDRASRYDYLYPESELKEWKTRIEAISGYAKKTFVVLNNDKGPKAFRNALQLQAMLKGGAAEADVLRRLRREAQTPLFTSYLGQAVA